MKRTDSLFVLLSHARHDSVRAKIHTNIASEYLKRDLKLAMFYADSAILLGRKTAQPRIHIAGMRLLGIAYAQAGNPDSAKTIFIRTLRESFLKNIRKEIVNSYNNLGNLNNVLGYSDSAIYYANRSLAIDSTIANRESAYNTIASAYRIKNEYALALSYNLRNLSISRASGDEKNEVRILTNTGNLYAVMEQFDKAIAYFTSALETVDTIAMPQEFATIMMSLGSTMAKKKEFDKAIQLYRRSAELFSRLGVKRNSAMILMNIGSIYQDKSMFAEAIDHYDQALPLLMESGDQYSIAMLQLNSGRCFFKLGKLQQAQVQLSNSLSLTKKLGFRDLEAKIYFEQHKIDSAQNNYQAALATFKKLMAIDDSVYTIAKEKQLAEIQEKYESEKKARQIIRLNQEVEQKHAQVIQQKNQLYLSVLISVLLLMLAMIFYERFRIATERRTSLDILEQHKIIMNAQEDIQEKISRDLHDNIGQKLVALKFRLENNEDEKPVLGNAIDFVADITREVRNVSHILSPHDIQNEGLIVCIQNLLEASFYNSSIKYAFEKYNLNAPYPPAFELNLYRICQELIANILKHAQATLVIIQLYEHSSHIILTVEDDGKGIVQPIKKGFGLTSIGSRVRVLKGSFNFASDEGRTTATIKIPL